jgi:hypothetical protein
VRLRSPADILSLFAAAALAVGCTGTIDAAATGGAGSGSTGAAGISGGAGNGGGQGIAGTPGDPNAAGLMPMRRLTNREYNNTVRDLLGDLTHPANQFPSDRDKTFAFRRAGDLAVQDATLLRTAAEALATAALPKLAPNMLLPCDPATGEDACAQKFITVWGQRAFRRPLAAPESMRLMALYTKARTTLTLPFKDALSVVIEAVLQSPQFLYHWEAVPTDPSIHEGAVVRLGPYQIASRLSYFLWGSMPDDMLLADAAAGRLDAVAGVQTAARRLLADPKAKDTVSAFFSDWLELDGLHERTKSATAYPEYNAALQTAMLDETSAFVQNVSFGGDGLLSTLLGAPYSYIPNQALATVYGAQLAQGGAGQRTELNPAQRGGFLTQASFLALTGSSDGSNPVRRGKTVYEKFLCKTLPPPPANVPNPKPASAGGTTRQRFAEHAMNACAIGCHQSMDPIGFAFENYDGIGKYRTMDNGQPVDATGSITVDGQKQTFNDAIGLVGILAKSPDVRRCFTTEWSRFALSRTDTPADLASLQSAAAAFAPQTATIQDLLVSVATMRSFRYRSPSAGEMP